MVLDRLSNELHYIHVAQGATKLSEVKLVDKKNPELESRLDSSGADGPSSRSFSSFNFEVRQFSNLLSYKGAEYLFGKS